MRDGPQGKQNQSRRDRYRVDPEYRQKMVLRARIHWLSTHWRSIVEPELFKTNAQVCREYYYRHHENRKARQRTYYQEHRKDVIVYQRRYAIGHRKELKEQARARRLANIDAVRKNDRERSRKKRLDPESKRYLRSYYQSVKGFIRVKRRQELRDAKAAFGNRCCQCGWDEMPELLEFDHVVPLAKKGSIRHWTDRNAAAMHYPERFRLVCPICHAVKSALWKRRYPATKVALELRETRAKKLSALGERCASCGYDECSLALQIDHVVPIMRKRQGTGTPSVKEIRLHPGKYQALCATCHKLKSTIEIYNIIPKVFWTDRKETDPSVEGQRAILSAS
jgi:5-methylcytosine-specific restriction endonuclease McrA